MQRLRFKVLAKDKKTKARVGEIRTPHGVIKTPAFVRWSRRRKAIGDGKLLALKKKWI